MLNTLIIIGVVVSAALVMYSTVLWFKVYRMIHQECTRLDQRIHTSTVVTIPEYPQHPEDAVFVYDPRMSHYPLYRATFAYFESANKTKHDWRVFAYRKKSKIDESLKETFPVGVHSFNFLKDPSVVVWFVVYEPTFVTHLNAMRYPFRIIVRGFNAVAVLHDMMHTITTEYINGGKALHSNKSKGPARVLQFKPERD